MALGTGLDCASMRRARADTWFARALRIAGVSSTPPGASAGKWAPGVWARLALGLPAPREGVVDLGRDMLEFYVKKTAT